MVVSAASDDRSSMTQSEEDWERFGDEAARGFALWKIAWHGEDVVGQVRFSRSRG